MANTMIAGRGSQQLTVGATAVSMTVPLGARRANILVQGADINMEVDGTAATTSDRLVLDGSIIDMTQNLFELAQFSFIRNASVSATLHISYYN